MINILIVDDKDENLYLLQSMLDMNGFKTISARNGNEALHLMRNNIPDLIITDILMPVMDGFTLCRECKKDERLKNIPFFFYTATYTDERDRDYALGLGADMFILKPQEPDEFLKIINDFLSEINAKKIISRKYIEYPEEIDLKEYNSVLIRKIEDKMLQSDKAEKQLKQYSEKLEKEILESREKEESLRASQELFKTLTQVSPVGIFQTTADGNTTYVNPKWCELTGLEPNDALGNGWLKAVHPDDVVTLSEKWSTESTKGVESKAEYRFLKADGNIVWVLGNAVPVFKGKKLSGYIGTVTDITERKIAEDKLKKSQLQLSNALRAAHLGPWEYDIKNDQFIFNDLFYAIFKTSADSVGGYSMKSEEYTRRFVHPDDITMIQDKIRNAIRLGGSDYSKQLEHRFISSEGEVGYITASFSAITNKQGSVISVFGVNQDITELRKMRDKIYESEIYYRTLFEGANDAILIMSEDVFVECNEKTISMFGCDTKEDIINHHPWEFSPLVQPDGFNSKEKASGLINTALYGSPQRFYWKHSRKNGDLFDAEISLCRINIGKKSFVQSLVTDISDRKKAEEDLIVAKEKAEESDKLKTAFLHNISHEVRTPMNAIIGFSDLIVNPALTPDVRNDFVQIIVKSSHQLLSIIDQIVNMATIEAGQEKIYEKEISLNSVLKLVFEQFHPEAESKNISLECKTSLPDNEDMIITDETKLIQVITNLVSNALKFTRQGSVTFGYDVKDKYLEFFIKDTGIGIPEEIHEAIFERFRQAESNLNREYGGAGLGLSISKAYVELLGGKIWLESKPMAGSIFYFNITYKKRT
ncbi:MAG TPA: PAS domain S-box protein [Bacteroidales bacterium]|nr:PAS domain S-box protein [Bacteroidales bacterium]